MSDIVCAIARGELEAEIVLHTEHVIAFLDHRPVFKGHVLVCPLPHAETLPDLPAEAVGPFFADVQRIAAALPLALGCTGTFVAINNKVSQSIPHLHVHVVPRTKGDGLRGFFWPRVKYAEGEPAAYGSLIREALGTQPPL
ncbi:MAG TPA: HIT family protein [Propionibacterium sp.]|jgi:histidine triad (HIT) family protein|nr:HIT family protein [Propionibacterium sp.]